jgi:hypothetical protein
LNSYYTDWKRGYIFFFCKHKCIRKEPTVQPLQGGKETEGGARPLHVGGGGEKEKKMGMQLE